MKFDQRAVRSTRRYQRMRANFLANENLLCAVCQRMGIVQGADELDHIVPASEAPERFWDPTNMQGICRTHHEEKTEAENRRTVPGQAEWKKRLEGF